MGDHQARRPLGTLGEIMPRFQRDYGYLIEIGANSFLNYDAILMDWAPSKIGDDVSIGPRAQLLTAPHPMADHELRRQRWESDLQRSLGETGACRSLVRPGGR